MEQTMKKAFGIITLLFFVATLYGQEARFDYSVYGGAGLSTLRYNTVVGRQENGYGGLLGGGVDYRITKNWSVGSGLEFSLYNARASMDRMLYKYMTTDMNGDDFEFRSAMNVYEEKQHALFLNIPLMVKYETGWNTNLYGALGAKVGIPVTAKYKISGDNMTTSGFYPHENYEYTNLPFMGFSTFPVNNKSDNVNFKLSFMFSAEVGVKWYLNPNMLLLTGIYVDYGLNNIAKGDRNDRLIQYNANAPKDFTFHSVLTSQYDNNGTTVQMADKVKPFAIGVKVGIVFGKRTKKTPPAPEPIIIKVPEKQPEPEKDTVKTAVADTTFDDTIMMTKEEEQQRLAEVKRDIALERTKDAQPGTEKTYKDSLDDISMPLVGYHVDEVEIPSTEVSEVDKKISFMKRHPDIKAHFTGYTCTLGTSELNLILGLKRANAVKAYMVSKGIEPSRITTSSKGRAEPLLPNTSEFNRRINRRVEFKFSETK